MGQLGDVLELFYGNGGQSSTVRATIRHWCNTDLANIASGGGRTPIGRRKTQGASVPRTEVADLSVWIDPPSRVRIEKRRSGYAEPSFVVVNGNSWWKRDHEGHVEVSEGDCRRTPGLADVERHFNAHQIRQCFQELALEATGAVRTCGRNCIRLRAIPRPGARLWPHWLSYGADEYEFHADAERPVLLSIASRFAGEVFERHDVLEVAFGERFPAELFTYQPVVGEQITRAVPISEQLSLEAAVQRVSFSVLVPTRVPDPEHAALMVMYHPPRGPSGVPSLLLSYNNFESRQHITLTECATPHADDAEYDWDTVEIGGRTLRVSDPGGEGKRIVALEQEGTHVRISSDLDRPRVLDLAGSLVAVPRA